MNRLVIKASTTEEWLTLIHEAQTAAACPLDEDMESYLVFLLMRYTERPDIATSVLALEYLHSMQLSGHLAQDRLREVGDKCLLYSGLFPERVTRRRVNVSYVVDLGCGAYQQLASRLGNSAAELYQRLAAAFVRLMDILKTIRELGRPTAAEPLHAYELWRDTGSRFALNKLRAATGATPLLVTGKDAERRH